MSPPKITNSRVIAPDKNNLEVLHEEFERIMKMFRQLKGGRTRENKNSLMK